ncbi:hypothetical protein BH24ACT7_BH24ACT7_26280 [soil metagenome]
MGAVGTVLGAALLAGCGNAETGSPPAANDAPVSGDLCVNRAQAVAPPPGEVFLGTCLTDLSTVLIIGSGFRPNEVLSFEFDDLPGHLTTGAQAAAQADATGRIDIEVDVGAPAGVLRIEGDAGSYGITGYFDLDAGVANADTPDPAAGDD